MFCWFWMQKYLLAIQCRFLFSNIHICTLPGLKLTISTPNKCLIWFSIFKNLLILPRFSNSAVKTSTYPLETGMKPLIIALLFHLYMSHVGSGETRGPWWELVWHLGKTTVMKHFLRLPLTQARGHWPRHHCRWHQCMAHRLRLVTWVPYGLHWSSSCPSVSAVIPIYYDLWVILMEHMHLPLSGD